MKSNVCTIKKGGVGVEAILTEVEKVTTYNELPQKDALRLRLLAEELTGMLTELVKNFNGVFWMQNVGTSYELHVELEAAKMSKEKKESLIAMSASGRNAAASGLMGKIREIAENMLMNADDSGMPVSSYQYMYDYSADLHYTYAWTLDNYVTQYKNEKGKEEDWDKLEKAIVEKLADDVVVGVRGKNVDIIIKKNF